MPRLTVTEYAALSVRLAHANTSLPEAGPAAAQSRAQQLLSIAGITSEQWDAEVAHWEEELSRAIDREDEVPQLLLDYSAAIQQTQAALSGAPIALETFSQILGNVQRGVPLDQALRQHHLSLPEFLSAQRHWMTLAASDPQVRYALEAALR